MLLSTSYIKKSTKQSDQSGFVLNVRCDSFLNYNYRPHLRFLLKHIAKHELVQTTIEHNEAILVHNCHCNNENSSCGSDRTADRRGRQLAVCAQCGASVFVSVFDF